MRNTRLLQLLQDNRRPFRPVEAHIRAQAGSDEATVYLYDVIVGDRLTAEWWGGVCPQDLVPALAAIEASTIHLRINSPGGDVFAAQAISQALREHPARIVGHVDGLAASAATDIACACEEVVMGPAAMYMIHQAWVLAMGNEDDMLATAALLHKVDDALIAEYVAYTGRSVETVTAWVKAETWFSAAEAVEHGFAHRIAEPAKKPAAAAQGAWNLKAYAAFPAGVQAPAQLALPEPEPQPTEPTEHRDRQQQRLRLLERLPIG